MTAISTFFSPNKLLFDDKINLINEGNVLSSTEAQIQLNFSENDRFPFKENFHLKRIFDNKKDEYQLNDENNITKEEMKGIFESVNLSNNNLFIIQQGKINQMSMLDDYQRYELIKEIAGANTYERDRKQSDELLIESKKNEEKIFSMLKSVDERINLLAKEKEKYKEYEDLEKKKREIEIGIYESEKRKVDEELQKMEIEDSKESESEEFENVQDEIKRLEKDLNTSIENVKEEDLNVLEKEIFEIEAEKSNFENKAEIKNNKLEYLKNEYNKNKTEIYAFKHEKEFLELLKVRNNAYNFDDEIEDTKKEILIKRKESEHTEKKENTKDVFKMLENLIEKRNKLWVAEKRNEDARKFAIENYKLLERKLIFVGGSQFSTYQEIKNMLGVHGCVFELLNIPEELFSALESVALNSLFNIVVENDEVVANLIKNIKSRVTFIPLNKVKNIENTNPNIEDAILLSSQIKCKEIYKPILDYVTRSAYLVSDMNTGVVISKNHNVNVVTIEGDYISKKGTLSGGNVSKGNFLSNLKKAENEVRKCEKTKINLKEELNALEDEIKKYKLKSENIEVNDEEYRNVVNGILIFLEQKLSILNKIKNGKSSIEKEAGNLNKLKNKINDLELKEININREINHLDLEIKTLLNKIKSLSKIVDAKQEKMYYTKRYNEFKSKKERLNILKEKIINFGNKENELGIKDFENEKCKMNRQVLLEKKFNLIKKIGNMGTENNRFLNIDRDFLYIKLKEVNEKLKKYVGINKKAIIQYEEFSEQKEKLAERISELKESRTKIDEFMHELDGKKEDAIQLTLSMVKDNFKYFYSKLSNGIKGNLILSENKISVEINNEKSNLKNLSGGQKTILALALIFSIQKIDPSPFYFFDEIDANLDQQSRINVSKVIREICETEGNNIQFFITTFREEMLEIGEKFFKVNFENKNSTIEEISIAEARNFVCEPVDNTF
ncbi:Structural maintenance of chromosomes protein 3 [Gurleya vavrai]